MNEMPAVTHGDSLTSIPTPALLLDRERLERNAARMRDKVRQLGVQLRPHVKTSKSIDVLRVLSGGQEAPITVSTLAEARYFFGHGVRDILYAVGIEPSKLPAIADLVRAGCRLRILLDSVEAARSVEEYAASADLPLEVVIEIDSDGCRAGVAPTDENLLAIARAVGPAARLAGVLTHAGASYACRSESSLRAMADQERDRVVEAADRLRNAGFEVPLISLGSTPTVTHAQSLDGVTEVRCGVYAFGDLVQAQLGSCTVDDIAISVLASVIGHRPDLGRVIVDAGFLALSRDRGTAEFPEDWGFGAICDLDGRLVPDVLVSSTSQEHGVISAREGRLDVNRFPIGSRVRILPNHSCATAAAHGTYQVLGADRRIVDRWDRINGW